MTDAGHACAHSLTAGGVREGRLGRRWQKLHKLVYLVVLLGVWHYWWQVKKDIREPLLYFAIFGVLMAFRAYRAFRVKSAPATAPERT